MYKKNKGGDSSVALPRDGAAMAGNDHTGQQSAVTLSRFVNWPFYVRNR